ncbi:hypothetical protein F5Y14DRAFT_457256 [Nemania sp. NC0429]|nr:hypothetical protein F5Y14DRAFT_457256 [Nemania sp. NC0429]
MHSAILFVLARASRNIDSSSMYLLFTHIVDICLVLIRIPKIKLKGLVREVHSLASCINHGKAAGVGCNNGGHLQHGVIRTFEYATIIMLISYSDTSFCLLGEFCARIGHSLTIFQDPELEACTGCDVHNKMSPARWSLFVHTETDLETSKPLRRTLSLGTIRRYNETVQMELQRILKKCTSYGQCRALLHYILSLPRYIDKDPLIDAFANIVGFWCRTKRGKELSQIAANHGFGSEFVFAMELWLERSEYDPELFYR